MVTFTLVEFVAMLIADDIRDAWSHLRGIVHTTPILHSRSLDEIAGGKVLLKMESFQRAGSFKFRGAFHALTRKLSEVRERGVVTGSSGNHGGALALAGRILGVPVTVVVPEDIQNVKRQALLGYGATIETAGVTSVERLATAAALAEDRGLVMVHPYDDYGVIAGQGTVALEVLDQVAEVDIFIAPVGGGGLLSGCATYLSERMPGLEVWGAEPDAANDTALSMSKGERVAIDAPDTLADGARNLTPGKLTFPLIRQGCRGILTVTEEQIREAVTLCLSRVKVVVEPTGAVALAAALFNAGLDGRTAVVVISGGNADPPLLMECLASD